MIEMHWKGTAMAGQRLVSTRVRLTEAVGFAMTEVTLDIARAAQALTPVDTDNLRKSIKVWPVVQDPATRQISVALTAGGPPQTGNVDGETNDELVDYAIPVHEDLTMNHPNGGQAKFLEVPMQLARPSTARRVTALVRARLRG